MMMTMRMSGAARVNDSRRAGFTRNDALALAAIIAVVLMVAVVVFPGFLVGPRGGHNPRMHAAAYLKDIHIAMYQYSVSYNDKFPIAGASDPAADAIGFAEGTRASGSGATLDNNVTASLWILVRIGAITPEQFINPAVTTARPDILTADGWSGTTQLPVGNTYDFSRPENLSYSPINMHHVGASWSWSANVHPEYVLMGDDNNSNWPGPNRHTATQTTGLTTQQVRDAENSRNHDGEGQHFMHGDGHVQWHDNPFAGVAADNVYAMEKAGSNVPPTVGNSDGDAGSAGGTPPPSRHGDTFLIPITGNGGGRGSLDPGD